MAFTSSRHCSLTHYINNPSPVLPLVQAILNTTFEDGGKRLAEKSAAVTQKSWSIFQVFPSLFIKQPFPPKPNGRTQQFLSQFRNFAIYILIWGLFIRTNCGINFRWCVKFPNLLFFQKNCSFWRSSSQVLAGPWSTELHGCWPKV